MRVRRPVQRGMTRSGRRRRPRRTRPHAASKDTAFLSEGGVLVRQAKPGKEEGRRSRNLRSGSAGRSRPGRLTPARYRVLRRGTGNRRGEAYTGSAWAVLSSLESRICGSRPCQNPGRPCLCPVWSGAEVPPGSENRARAQGPSRNLGDPAISPQPRRGRGRRYPPQAPRSASDRGERTGASGVTVGEGDRSRRDGSREVGARHCTDETGEPHPGTRRREGGAGSRDRRRER
jgi:hypothetical protein